MFQRTSFYLRVIVFVRSRLDFFSVETAYFRQLNKPGKQTEKFRQYADRNYTCTATTQNIGRKLNSLVRVRKCPGPLRSTFSRVIEARV